MDPRLGSFMYLRGEEPGNEPGLNDSLRLSKLRQADVLAVGRCEVVDADRGA